MQKNYKNKAMSSEENKNQEEEYFYPDYGLTIWASSKEDAEKKLQEKIKKIIKY